MKPAKLQFQLGRGSTEVFKVSEGVPGKQKVGNHCYRCLSVMYILYFSFTLSFVIYVLQIKLQ